MELCVICFGQILMVSTWTKISEFLYLTVITCPPTTLLEIQGWGISPRGAGYLFGEDVAKQFAHSNDIDLIARAHQLVLEGYKLMFDSTIVTVWSAPNYCYRCGNVASILKLDDGLNQKYETFDAAAQE